MKIIGNLPKDKTIIILKPPKEAQRLLKIFTSGMKKYKNASIVYIS